MVRLMVLGLLSKRPMHGYEMQQLFELNKTDQWSGILPGSIYHALKKMNTEGLVEVQSVEHTGHRTRAIYAITPDGLEEYRRLLREAWRTTATGLPSGLYTILSFVDDLPREEVLAAIDHQIAELEKRIALWDVWLGAKGEAVQLPVFIPAAFQNAKDHQAVDLRFLRYLREVLPTIPVQTWDMPLVGDQPEGFK